jgi:hypothetical protein
LQRIESPRCDDIINLAQSEQVGFARRAIPFPQKGHLRSTNAIRAHAGHKKSFCRLASNSFVHAEHIRFIGFSPVNVRKMAE